MFQFTKILVIPRHVGRMLNAVMGNALAYQNILEMPIKVVVRNVFSIRNVREIRHALIESVSTHALVYVRKMHCAMY